MPSAQTPSYAGQHAHVSALILEFASKLLEQPVTPQTHFFAAGGDSLQGARLITMLRRELGRAIGLSSLMRHPRLADLTAALVAPESVKSDAEAGASSGPAELSPVPPYDAGTLPLASNQRRRLWHDELHMKQGRRINHTLSYAARVGGELDVVAAGAAIEAVIARHDALRVMVDFASEDFRACIHQGPFRPVRVIDASGWSEPMVTSALEDEDNQPFSPDADPKLRLLALRHDAKRWTLMFTAEHLVCDAFSLEILLRDFSVAYAAFRQGSTLAWPGPAPSQLAWAAAETEALQGTSLQQRLAYWRGRLDPLQAIPEFVIPGAVEPTESLSSPASVQVSIGEGFGDSVHDVCAKLGATAFSLFAAAMAITMHAVSGLRVASLMAPVNARPAGFEQGVGWFSQTMPVRIPVPGRQKLADLVLQVGEIVADGVDNILPSQVMIENLQPERTKARGWHPWVFLDVQRSAEDAPALDLGAQITPLGSGRPALRYGIAVFCRVARDRVAIFAQYEADSLSSDAAGEFIESYAEAIRTIVGRPEIVVRDFAHHRRRPR